MFMSSFPETTARRLGAPPRLDGTFCRARRIFRPALAVLGLALGLLGGATASFAQTTAPAPAPTPSATAAASTAPAAAGSTAAAPATTQAAAGNGATASAPAAPAAKAPSQPLAPVARALVIWSGSPGEVPPSALVQSLGGELTLLSGPLTAAGRAVQKGRQALIEMRCSDALAPLETAVEQLASDVPIAAARPLLGELYGLLLSCADRVNDAARTERATAALRALEPPLPPDVALILQRQPPSVEGKDALPVFGPPRAPVLLETDPPGAAVLRNYVYLGVTPLTIAGGRPDRDRLDIEGKGMRKLRRPLESGARLVLSLRPEERAQILAEAAAFYKLGSNEQAEALAALSQARDLATVAPTTSSVLLVVGPKLRSGTALSEEPLAVRAYDLKQRKWLGATGEIAAGGAVAQAQALRELAGRSDGSAKAAVPAGALAKAPADANKKKTWLPFAKTKWYNWVIAGGVAALIAGLLISERVTPEKVVITATK